MKINHVKVRDWKIRIRPYEWIIWAILLIVVAVVVNNNVRLNLKNYHTDFAVLSAFFLLLFAYKFVSAMKKTLKGYKHEVITRDNYPIVYGLIRNIEIRTGTKVLPKAYVIEHKESRAMALSYGIFSFNAILFSKKFLQEATQDELECIIAHEIGHIRCREALIVIFQLLITVLLFQYLFFLKIDQISEITRENFSWRLLLTQLFYSFYVFILAYVSSGFIFNQLNKRSELYADYFAVMATGKSRPLIDFLQKKFDECLIKAEFHNRKLAVIIYRFHVFFFSSHPTIMKRVECLKDLE